MVANVKVVVIYEVFTLFVGSFATTAFFKREVEVMREIEKLKDVGEECDLDEITEKKFAGCKNLIC